MTITAGDLDSSAFNIQGIGFATGLAGPLVGCRDSAADNFNIDTGGVYGTVGAYIMFNTHSDPGDPNECLYTGCMDPNSSSFFSTVYNGNTYYATTPGPCDYEGCNDLLAYNFNTTCSGYVLPSGTSITITNNGCCTYPQSWGCDTVNGGCTTMPGGTGSEVVCHDFYDPSALANTPAGCHATPIDAMAAACTSGACPACGSSSVQGCTDDCSPNYDPLATCDDGSCTTVVYGCMDNGSMTAGQVNSSSNSIWPSNACLGATCNGYDSYDSTWSYIDLTGIELNINLGDDIEADNYNPLATHMDCSCEYHGCTDSNAINYESFYTHEDGSCIYAGCTDPTSIGGVDQYYHPNPGTFYINPIDATIDDGSCVIFGCNDIETPNVIPWNGNPIKETMINDNGFEEALESRNEYLNPSGSVWGQASGTGMEATYLGHAGDWNDTTPPLTGPGSVTGLSCGIPSMFANNVLNIQDYGNGIFGDCSAVEELTHMGWRSNTPLTFGNVVYDGLSCTQGFANAWGPISPLAWNSASSLGGSHNDGFYLQRNGFPTLCEGGKTFFNPVGTNITDLSGIQDNALNPAFKRLVIHNQYITSFIHTEPDPASPYHGLDMLDTLFQHAPNFDCLSLKSCTLGGTGQVLDLTGWSNCGMIEITDISYDEVNVNHIDNPNCYSICIVNDKAPSNDNGNIGGNIGKRNGHAAATFSSGNPSFPVNSGGYSKALPIDWASHTPGDIPSPKKIHGSGGTTYWMGDLDESYRQAWNGGGHGYAKAGPPGTTTIPLSLVGASYENPDPAIGEHFPPQAAGFSGWDPATSSFITGPANRFVPQHKLAPISPDMQLRSSIINIPTRRGSQPAWEGQMLIQNAAQGNAASYYQGNFNNYLWHYQGNIMGDQLMGTSNGPGGIDLNGHHWTDRPSTPFLGSNPQGVPVGSYYGSSNPGCSLLPSNDPNSCISNPFEDPDLFNPPDPTIKIDNELTLGIATDAESLGYVLQSRLILINLKNLRHVWLGPDWKPIYAMNHANNMPNPGPLTSQFAFNPKNSNARGFSIKGCGNGQTVYVHTSGRAMEFQKRYGTNDQTAVNQYGDSIYSAAGETFFLEYFDSNVVFVD